MKAEFSPARYTWALLLAACVLTGSSTAGAITVAAFDRGLVGRADQSGGVGGGTTISHNPGDTSMVFSGTFGGFVTLSPRGYYLFDIPSIGGTVSGATLNIDTTQFSCAITCGSGLSISLKEVTSPASAFQTAYNERSNPFPGGDPLGPGFALWGDLSDGAAYGSGTIAGLGTTAFALDAAAPLAAINSARGGFFAIAVTESGPLGVFGLGNATLDLTTVPEPGTAALLAIGLVGLAWVRR